MGAWGTNIFGNDLSCDVRDAYRERISAGDDPETAVKLVKRAFAESLGDSTEKWTVWIALAAAQLKVGTITDEVRDRALQGITQYEKYSDTGSESLPYSLRSLAAVWKKLGGQARIRAKRIKPKTKTTPGDSGEVFAVRFPNSNREAVIVNCGSVRNDRPPHYGRVVLLFEMAVERVTSESVRQALLAWRPYQRVWHDGPSGRVHGCYDASGKLPARKARLLLRLVDFPVSFERHMKMLAETYRSAELPYIIEYDFGEWEQGKLGVKS